MLGNSKAGGGEDPPLSNNHIHPPPPALGASEQKLIKDFASPHCSAVLIALDPEINYNSPTLVIRLQTCPGDITSGDQMFGFPGALEAWPFC